MPFPWVDAPLIVVVRIIISVECGKVDVHKTSIAIATLQAVVREQNNPCIKK